jgi:ABC-2 type transport system ATP-binding protein
VFIKDIPVHQNEEWKKFTSAFLDESFLIPYLTPEEYFAFLGTLRGRSPEEVKADLAPFESFFGGEVLGQHKYIRDLSKGNQKKVGIAGAFIGQPSLIILDEPFANLDPSSQIHLKKILNRLRQARKHTFLISSHNLDHITDVTDRIVLLHEGQIRRDMEVNEHTLDDLIRYFESQIAGNEMENGNPV